MIDLVWFKRDLRMQDHRPLVEAAARGPVLALYVAEPGYWALPDTSARQWAFIAECLSQLRLALQHRGSDLVIRQGDVVDVLTTLNASHRIKRLWSHEETGNAWTFARDKAVAAFCREQGIDWTEIPQFGVVRRLATRNAWSSAWEARMAEPVVRAPERITPVSGLIPGDIPTAEALGLAPDPCPDRQHGGRRAAKALLDSFLSGRGIRYQREMSSPLTAFDACSRLSAHLSAGTISMRETVQALYAARRELTAQPQQKRAIPVRALDALIGRMHWHCHFIQKLESEPAIEWRAVHPLHEQQRMRHGHDDPLVEAWIEGRTGFPFVDACMRALKHTGWINFRMRAMLMAFASYQLNLDWTVTGAALARRFTDYEPGIHWSQVQMQSGQTGINTPRMYNPVKQSLDQDKDGVFIRRFVPELAALPTTFIHEPWTMTLAQQEEHGVVLGEHYPARVVDHIAAARAARARLTEARHGEGYRAEARQVYVKHGSRKRTVRDDNPARNRAINAKRAEKAALQLKLDL
jgi:deoxyribodipyrimidine photo-lyase